MYQDFEQIVYRIAAMQYSLKNWHYASKYARHLLADRLNDGDDDTDEMSLSEIVDLFQEGVFNGACMDAIPEEKIAEGCRKYIVPKMDTNFDQARAIMQELQAIIADITKVFPRADVADQKLLGDAAFSLKLAVGHIYRGLFGNNEIDIRVVQ